jgi:ribosomal protein S18 acetylase RimI-like enzyme
MSVLETLSVRDVLEPDLPSLRDFYRTVWRATYERTLGPAAVDILISGLEKSDLKHLLPSQSRRAGIADFGGLPVGTAFITEKDGIGYLWGMYVQPAWQRRGVGSALLRYVTNRPTQIVSLETQVHVASLQARAFYLKTGFREIGRKSSEVAPGQIEEFLVMRATPETE